MFEHAKKKITNRSGKIARKTLSGLRDFCRALDMQKNVARCQNLLKRVGNYFLIN